MKKILFFLSTLFVCTVSANTIHWITFIDTTDPNVGECDKYSREFLYSRWISEVNAAIAPLGYSSEIHDFYGEETSPQNCKEIIESIECESEDDRTWCKGTKRQDTISPNVFGINGSKLFCSCKLGT